MPHSTPPPDDQPRVVVVVESAEPAALVVTSIQGVERLSGVHELGPEGLAAGVRARHAGLIVLVSAIMVLAFALRTTVDVSVLRDRAALFTKLSDGGVRNGYTLKILNMSDSATLYTVSASGIDGLELSGAEAPIRVEAGRVEDVGVVLRAREADLTRRSETVWFTLTDNAHPASSVTEEARFLGPSR